MANVQPQSKMSSSYLWSAEPYCLSSPAKQILTSEAMAYTPRD